MPEGLCPYNRGWASAVCRISVSVSSSKLPLAINIIIMDKGLLQCTYTTLDLCGSTSKVFLIIIIIHTVYCFVPSIHDVIFIFGLFMV